MASLGKRRKHIESVMGIPPKKKRQKQFHHGLQSALETNVSKGNPRKGQKFRRVTNRKGQEVHVYEGGRRVVDKTPTQVNRRIEPPTPSISQSSPRPSSKRHRKILY